MPRSVRRFAPLVLCALAVVVPAAWGASFTTFESGQVRPVALSPDGTKLFAVDTPDDRLEIFAVGAGGLTHTGTVPVGMEPVAVAARSNTEVWVVNHLSDSVSVVDLSGPVPHVVRTLLVGDEPRDVVFTANGRAFITTAHRGQQRTSPTLAAVPGAGDPQLTTAGVNRADVWVFDAANPGTTLGGLPLAIVTLFGDTPRALAVSPDGGTVYAAVFKSGNRTTSLSEGVVCNGFTSAAPCSTSQGFLAPGGLPGPATDALLEPAPETGLIVKFDQATSKWKDTLGRDWSPTVRFSLPDRDVFAIDAATLAQTAVYSGVGTTLFNMAVNPVSGAVYVSNTEARNEVRFEGPGVFGGSTVQGHLAESRVTILSGGVAQPRRLNKHIDYSVRPAPAGVKDHSLATPTGMAVSPDGTTLYVAAFGSSKIGVLDTAALQADSLDPTVDSARYIAVTGGGPSGVALDAAHDRLYVLTRFDDGVSTIDLATGTETGHVLLHNPEPASVVAGRPFLYDAVKTSSNGEAACASCHIFGDMDDLAWDLGNPDDAVKKNPIPVNLAIAITSGFVTMPKPINGTGRIDDFHPMKGPMTTQTLRGLLGSGAMHWRGDRSNPPGTAASAFDENNSFNNFNVAFVGLVGRDSQLTTAEMQSFTDFALQITLPPNPIRAIDDSLTPDQAGGRAFFFGPRRSDGTATDLFGPTGFTCDGCHTLDPANRHFGTAGRASFENEEQVVKIPHLRNLYQKIGMFGIADVAFEDPFNQPFQGDQIRGFGFLHDGSIDTLFRFLHGKVFSTSSFGGPAVGFQTDTQRRQVEQFLLAFDTNLAPAVGQQITLDATNGVTVGARITLLSARAAAGDCDLIAKAVVAGQPRGWVRRADGTFQSDRAAEVLTDTALRLLAATPGQEVTYTCVPPGAGVRSGIDRDEDGYFDADERDAGSDPADASSFPGSSPVLVSDTTLALRADVTFPVDPMKAKISFRSSTKKDPAANRIVLPAAGSQGDPTVVGATLLVYNAAGLTDDAVTVTLPAAQWTKTLRKGVIASYRFTGTDPNGPITSVVVAADAIRIRGGKTNWSYSLDEAQQGAVAVRLRFGNQEGWCAAASAKAKGVPPSTAKSDHAGAFTGAKSPAPASCPAVPAVSSPSGAFL